jgi:hypothetical protein
MKTKGLLLVIIVTILLVCTSMLSAKGLLSIEPDEIDFSPKTHKRV